MPIVNPEQAIVVATPSQVQVAYISGTATSSSGSTSYSGPEPPSYAPSFAGQTVSWNGNNFRSDDGKTWIFQGSDAERAAAEAAVKARELAEAEAKAQDAGVYLQKSNLLEPFMDINKNASDYGLRDAEYVIIRGPYKATVYSDYRGGGNVVGIYSGQGTYKLPTTVSGSVRAEVILPPAPDPLPEIPVPMPTPTMPPPSGYSGQYFDNQTLSGTPKLTRSDTAINFDWGGGSPDPAIPIDHFSARWTKTETFAAGDYQFSMTGDDGIRLYLDDQLIIDKWIDQGATTYIATKTLSAGDHTIKMEYYENGGGAVAELSYQEVIATPPPPPPSSGYGGQYFDNKTLTGTPKLTRNDQTINFDWGGGSPDSLIPIDNFSVRWTKTETFTSGTYQFSMTGDDGVRLYIDNVLAIDKWILQGPTTYTTTQTLSAGSHTIKMEFYESGGGAVAKLSYQEVIVSTPTPTPALASNCTELLTTPWHLEGTNAQEKYQGIASTALQGKANLKITYNLHGLKALGGDASAIIFDQNGWRYISLSNYGQNGLDGAQTVTIPLSAFGLNLAQSVGTLHTRFWYSSYFVADISSIVACS